MAWQRDGRGVDEVGRHQHPQQGSLGLPPPQRTQESTAMPEERASSRFRRVARHVTLSASSPRAVAWTGAAAVAAVVGPEQITDPLSILSGITSLPMRSNPFLHPTVPEWTGEMDAFERAARLDLAAAYRLCVEDELNEGVCNHLTVAMPGNDSFLVVPFGLHWGEVTASRLILVDGEGSVRKGPAGATVEDTAYLIHGAMHSELGDRGRCIMHTHMPYATALCALASDADKVAICN